MTEATAISNRKGGNLRAFSIGPFVWQTLLLGLGFLILVLIALIAVVLANRSQEQGSLIVHTVQVESQIRSLLLEMRRAESAERGYIITGDREYMEVYGTARGEALLQFDLLRNSVADNPEQVRILTEMRPLVENRFSDLARGVEAREAGDLALVEEIVRQGRGTIEEIREQAEAMLLEEERLLSERSAAVARTNLWLVATTIGGVTLIVLLAAASIVLVGRSNRDRAEAERVLRETNQNLEKIIDERSGDLREANEEIQRFAYIVSHDLRSPLVNIMGFTSELEALRSTLFDELASLRAQLPAPDGEAAEEARDNDTELAEEFDEAIGFIKSSISKMDRLINAILQLSRMGSREFKPESIDMNELADAIVTTMSHQAEEAEATIAVGDLPKVESDRLALEQIFGNLIDNALKYLDPSRPGDIRIEGRESGTRTIYEVRDNGRGIDTKDHARIFELFRRSGQPDRPGEGIGLAHVRALVRKLGGTVRLTSTPGEGTTFFVSLPKFWIGARGASKA